MIETLPERSVEEQSPSQFLPVLVLLFVGSGCAALIYEVVWLQMLQLVIGSTAVSLGVLLGTFMGGMCIGSLLLPRLISPRFHPLRVYAVLELLIAAVAVAILFGMPLVERLYTTAGTGVTWRLSLMWRGLVCVLCLLPPTILMGATLPAVSRWVSATPGGVSWLGFFYGGNIVGAVFGCLLAGFYLLRVLDMSYATFIAAAINVLVAVVAILLAGITRYSRRQRHEAVETDDELEPAPPLAQALAPAPSSAPVYVAICLSGLTALGAEVVWTRLMSLMLGATVYTFSIILAVFLLGLGIGSSLGAVIGRLTPRPRVALGVCQLMLAGAIAWTAFCISYWMPWLPIDPATKVSPWHFFQLDLAICLWATLPAAMLWGASFPLALASVARAGQDPGRLVGGIYAANTAGAILGALLFALLIIPTAGTAWSQRLLILLATASSLIVLLPMLTARRLDQPELSGNQWGLRVGLGCAAVLPLALVLAWTIAPLPWQAVAWGRYSGLWGVDGAPGVHRPEDVPKVLADGTYTRACIYVAEGINVTVAVTQTSDNHRYFHGAGKVQASTVPQDMRVQRMLGHIAALVHGNPQDVLVVACGAGVTAGSFVPYDSVRRIVVCDIEPLVPQKVAPMFAAQNHNVIADPRTQVVEDDGRHFIRVTREKFDIITSDPIDPWVKGCAALNTVEYYQMCRERLKPGGVMALWVPLYENSEESINSLISTFFKVFPYGILWSNDYAAEGYDAVLFGQVEPTVIDVDRIQSFIESSPKVRQSLADVGFGAVYRHPDGRVEPAHRAAVSILATYAGQARDMGPWLRDDLINRDINLRLQYLAGLGLNQQIADQILRSILTHYRFPSEIFHGSPQTIAELKKALADQGRPQPVE